MEWSGIKWSGKFELLVSVSTGVVSMRLQLPLNLVLVLVVNVNECRLIFGDFFEADFLTFIYLFDIVIHIREL